MPKYDEANNVKIEAGQICDPENFPPPNELVCVEVQKIFDQVALRDCVVRTVTLIPGSGVINPMFTFEGADSFDIVEVRVVSKTDSLVKPGFKKLKLFVKIRYNIYYSDSINHLTQVDEAAFNLTINEIYCPSCLTQIGVIRYPEDQNNTIDPDGLLIKIEALAEAFNDSVNPASGLLSLDIGVFFVVKCACNVQLLIPSYGYCPVPPEQTVNSSTQNCHTFNDRKKTPFPTQFFPEQKFNPLDKFKKDYERDDD
ncbi:MAG: hypothetical protein QHH06_03985 [Clostridiales bacterium]|jgi:hypothetical protein|nr:hypothetical protein [Eubacteriales bacterium]MDH7565626.1 hypothetical protein [Clostridiales bacterium]